MALDVQYGVQAAALDAVAQFFQCLKKCGARCRASYNYPQPSRARSKQVLQILPKSPGRMDVILGQGFDKPDLTNLSEFAWTVEQL